MKRILCGAVSVWALLFAASLSTADAADMPIKPPVAPAPACVWCGWYVGGNIGFATTSDNGILNTGTDTGAAGLGSAIGAGNISSQVPATVDGFIGGGQIGYDWTFFRSMVVGLVADFDAMSNKKNFNPAPGGGFTTQFDREADWVSTYRVRFGDTVLYNTALIYITAGVAVAEWGISSACTVCAAPLAGSVLSTSNSITRAGGAVGAGLEWMVAPHVSVAVEYLYVETANSASTIAYNYAGPNNSTMTSTARDGLNILRADVNWHF